VKILLVSDGASSAETCPALVVYSGVNKGSIKVGIRESIAVYFSLVVDRLFLRLKKAMVEINRRGG